MAGGGGAVNWVKLSRSIGSMSAQKSKDCMGLEKNMLCMQEGVKDFFL